MTLVKEVSGHFAFVDNPYELWLHEDAYYLAGRYAVARAQRDQYVTSIRSSGSHGGSFETITNCLSTDLLIMTPMNSLCSQRSKTKAIA